MAAEGDNLISTPQEPDMEGELRYIDHKECKLISPGREKFSPSKPPISQIDQQNNILNNEADVISASKTVQNSLKEAINESGLSDSGLDSSNSSEEASGGKFVDHQESHVSVDEPESITSPVKMVDDLFSFVNEPQSLDAVNNNSEMNVQTSQNNGECYHGMEVDLHEQKMDTERNTRAMEQSAAEINLYWYNKTLDLDPSELESFNNNQGGACTSNVQVIVGDKYLNNRLDSTKTFESENRQQTSEKAVEKNETKDKWSSSIESASSRFLNLASEMKFDSKPKSSSNVPAAGTSVDEPLQHPWGLDGDNKVLVMQDDDVQDDLPEVPHLTPHSEGMADDVIDGDVPEDDDDIDVTDAMGHMELKDKDKIVQAEKDAEEKQSIKVEETENLKTGICDRLDDDNDVDVADAIGYMEWKDKDRIIEASNLVNETMQSIAEAGAGELTKEPVVEDEGDKNIKIESENIVSTVVQNVHSQMMKSSGEFRSEESNSIRKPLEQDTVDGSDVGRVEEQVIEIQTVKQVKSSFGKPTEMHVYKEEIFEPMQIQRKFRMIGDVEDKLVKLGANLLEVENLVDEYLDDENFSLCLSDCWLRLRNKKFEMKVNETLHCSSKVGIYNEIQIEKEVRQYLLKKFAGKLHETQDQDLPLDVIVDRLGLTEFATIETVKKSYQLDQCTIALELTDLMPQVCEVEVTVDRPSKILQALHTICSVASKLDLKPLQGI